MNQKTKRKSTILQVSVSQEMLNLIHKLADDREAPISQVIREALSFYLIEQGLKKASLTKQSINLRNRKIS